MENEVMIFNGGELAPKFDQSVLEKLATASEFLPRIKLLQSGSTEVKSRELKLPQGEFAICWSKTKAEALGEEFDVVPIDWRPKAMRFLPEATIHLYDIEHPEFQKIQEDAKAKVDGALAGAEFLVYVPERDQFATFYLTSPTALGQAPAIARRVGKLTTLKAEYIQGKKYSWFGFGVFACSASITAPADLNERIQRELDKFRNPPVQEMTEPETDEEVAR